MTVTFLPTDFSPHKYAQLELDLREKPGNWALVDIPKNALRGIAGVESKVRAGQRYVRYVGE